MKNVLFTSLLFISLSSFTINDKGNDVKIETSEVSWEKDTHNFGEIPQKKPVSIDFEFTNTGNTPLVITNVKTSCGCTATNYPKTAIAPGVTSKITVAYNANALGAFSKTITVVTNTTEQTKLLQIKGTVIK